MSQLTLLTIKGQCIAEFLGTGLLIFFGAVCVAAMKLAGASFGQWENSIIWGMGMAIAIYFTAAVFGAHLSPTVTIALWLFASFLAAQSAAVHRYADAGAFCAAALVDVLYYNLFFDYEQAHHIVCGSAESLDFAGIFLIYPNPHISVAQAFLIEIVITAILRCLILAPLLIGILIAIIGASIGPLDSFALNPAHDFGPKTFAFPAVWGKIAYTGVREIPYFLIPLIALVVSACLGAFGYRTLIGPHLPGQLIGEEVDDVAVTQSRSEHSEPKTLFPLLNV